MADHCWDKSVYSAIVVVHTVFIEVDPGQIKDDNWSMKFVPAVVVNKALS